ncbi:hypothetical protein TKK_0015645 [Trichogramma kaykai]
MDDPQQIFEQCPHTCERRETNYLLKEQFKEELKVVIQLTLGNPRVVFNTVLATEPFNWLQRDIIVKFRRYSSMLNHLSLLYRPERPQKLKDLTEILDGYPCLTHF